MICTRAVPGSDDAVPGLDGAVPGLDGALPGLDAPRGKKQVQRPRVRT